MTIVIPIDERVNEIVVDVRDILAGAELEFNAENEFNKVFKSRDEIIKNNFVTEFVFTIQKTDFKFLANEESFVLNIKKVAKKIDIEIENLLQRKYVELNRMLEKNKSAKATAFNKKFLKHIRRQYSNLIDSGQYKIIPIKNVEKVILGERAFSSSVQLVGISVVNSSKKLGLDNKDFRNIKITEIGICPENLLEAYLDNIVKDKKAEFKYNKYIQDKLQTSQNTIEM